jgi:NAD(P)-dependent dehydrogenase (short-subunit alcohol dehydrogenase family)
MADSPQPTSSPRTVFISGGSRGIGLALARRFHQAGDQVIIAARGEDRLAQAQADLPGLHTERCDLADKSAVKDLARRLNRTYGPLDILINNAGLFRAGSIHEETDETYELMMRTNVDSAYYLTKGVLPLMIERGRGSIVNMDSIAGMGAYPKGGSYSISKYALLGFSRNLRAELRGMGIRVITVMPGATWTDSWAGIDEPPQRFMPPEDVAEVVWHACQVSTRTVVEEIVLRPQLGDL